jgi:aryl-alcohol dehydrogenase-like predicted oxidoreductase
MQWSLAAREGERELVPAARAFGLGVLAWSPLGRGFLSGKYRRGAPPPAGTRLASWQDTYRQFDNDRCWRVLDAVEAVARRLGSTPSAVSLAWLVGRPELSSVIVGARTEAQLEENLKALSVKLPPEDVAELDRVSAPEWGYPQNFIGVREPW